MNLEQQLGSEWYKLLGPLFSDPSIDALGKLLNLAHQAGVLTPKLEDVFKAYEYVQPSQLKVLIVGQDPYPTPGVAHGLAFSYRGKNIPRSLQIIFEELEREGYGKRTNADLTDWAKQGVMLLNTVLTTVHNVSFAHKDIGWERFTATTLQHINRLTHPHVILAWGTPAQELVRKYIDVDPNYRLILAGCHPMAQQYSGGKIKFVGNKHFTLANEHLILNHGYPINWVPYNP